MTKTKIEWADVVWNPVTGCTPISSGCTHCYAKRVAETRLAGRCGYPSMPNAFRVTLHKDTLINPRWPRPRRDGRPVIVFVNSMGDLFHEDVPIDWIMRVGRTMYFAPPHLRFVILTKRTVRMNRVIRNPDSEWVCLSHIWLGVSAENQFWMDTRCSKSVDVELTREKRILSVEPMLGPVCDIPNAISWVICGAETGPGHRWMNPDWARSLRDECVKKRIPFFFKRDSDGNRTIDGVMYEEFPYE